MNQMALPHEVLDEIVGHLHDDRPTLRILSTVSSKFLPTCRQLLFNHPLVIRGSTSAQWDDRLQQNPTLCRILKEIDVRVLEFQGDRDQEIEHTINIWNRLFNLKKIWLTSNSIVIESWTLAPERLQTAIFALLSKPHLTGVVITNLTIPISLLSKMHHLQEIEVISSDFETSVQSVDAGELSAQTTTRSRGLGVTRPQLKEVSVSGSSIVYLCGDPSFYEIVEHPDFPFDLTNIVRLNIELRLENIGSVQSLLASCCKHLRHLNFSLQGGATSLRGLSSLSTLSMNLEVTVWIMHDDQTRNDMISGLFRTLESLATDNQPSSIPEELVLFTVVHASPFSKISDAFWKDLDSLLGSRISPTMKVKIVTEGDREYRPRMLNWRLLFPILEESGRLTLLDKD